MTSALQACHLQTVPVCTLLSPNTSKLHSREGMSAVMAEMNIAHAAHLKPSELSTPSLAGSESDPAAPDTALAAASLPHVPAIPVALPADAAGLQYTL